MLWLNLRRVFRSGSINVLRNSFVSLASIFVMTMTLVIIGSLMFLNALIGDFVTYLKDKVDVNVYFVTNANEKSILELKQSLESIPEVKFVTYTTREEAVAQFRARHEEDQLTLQALDELGDNPFGASLAVKAKETSQYEGIAQFLNERTTEASGAAFIDSVNYAQNKSVISQLSNVTKYVQRFGWAVIIIFTLASILITFNTIRLAIYTSREEISVMKLVGASNMYTQGPFVVEGTLYGAISGFIALMVFLPLSFFLNSPAEIMFGSNIFEYYLTNLWLFALVLIGTGMILGSLSSFLAVRKYLQV
jgi:cell division transport system permease protein